jgi:hypothetical protein
MFLGRTADARALYLQHRREKNVQGDKSWIALVLEDFAELRSTAKSASLRWRSLNEARWSGRTILE